MCSSCPEQVERDRVFRPEYDASMAIAQSLLDELWDFSDAAASEERLRRAAEQQTDAGSRAELETQVARALGLQERFDEADEMLDRIRADSLAVGVRVSLERGRLRNSGGDPAAAAALFRAAADAASGPDLAFLRVDALHMLAIVDADHREQWTTRAFAVLDALEDARTQRWRVALHNNLGWAHFDDEDYAAALAAFEESKAAATRWGTPQQVVWAEEAIAEARSLL
jgi:tetratricopeptide (TPR) repeat protein